MKHPFVTVALVYGGGLVLGDYVQPPVGLLFLVALAVAVLAAAWTRARARLLWPLVFLCGWTNLVSRTAILSPRDLRAVLTSGPEIVTVRGTLEETPSQRVYMQDQREVSRSLVVLETREILRPNTNWQASFGRVLVLTPGVLPAGFYQGQTVEVTGVLAVPDGPRAEGLFDYRKYLRRQGMYFQLKAESANDWVLVSGKGAPPLSDRFIAWAQATLARGLPVEDDALHLLWAMTLGWKTGLTNEIYEPFMQSGTMHIFAISGLHIALISGILVSVLRVARVSRGWCGGVVVPLLWFYTGVTGWQPSAIRSAIMMTVVIGGWSLKRPSDLLNSLAAAAFIILVWEPQQLFGASFQLSFFCVLSMALLLPPVREVCTRLLSTDPLLPAELVPAWRRKLHGPLRWLLNSVATSLAAWLGSLPLTAYYFHLFSPVTLLANLLIVPLSSLALSSNVASLLCGGWFGWAGELFNHSAWFWMDCMIRLSHWAAWVPGFFLYIKSPSLLDLFIYYTFLVGMMSGWVLVPGRRAWAGLAAAVVAVCYLGHWALDRSSARLAILPVNGGLSIFAHTPHQGGDLLIDPGATNSVEFCVKPYLRGQGVNRLPLMLLTHGDNRHVGGSALLADAFAVPRVVAGPVRFRSPTYRRALGHFAETPGRLLTVSRNQRVANWKVLHPGLQDRWPQADDNTLVLMGTVHGTRVLLLSDFGPSGQKALLQRGNDLKADIVITGLSAGGQALTDEFLRAVRPRLVIVADAEFPASERASPGLQARLNALGVDVLYTRSAGATTIDFRPGQWELRTMNGLRLRSQTHAAR